MDDIGYSVKEDSAGLYMWYEWTTSAYLAEISANEFHCAFFGPSCRLRYTTVMFYHTFPLSQTGVCVQKAKPTLFLRTKYNKFDDRNNFHNNLKFPEKNLDIALVPLQCYFKRASIMLWWKFFEVVFWWRLLMITPISFTETVHRIRLTVTAKEWWVNSVFSFVAAAKYVYTHRNIEHSVYVSDYSDNQKVKRSTRDNLLLYLSTPDYIFCVMSRTEINAHHYLVVLIKELKQMFASNYI